MTGLRDIWEETSFQLERFQTDYQCVQQEQQGLKERLEPPYHIPFESEIISFVPRGRPTSMWWYINSLHIYNLWKHVCLKFWPFSYSRMNVLRLKCVVKHYNELKLEIILGNHTKFNVSAACLNGLVTFISVKINIPMINGDRYESPCLLVDLSVHFKHNSE